MLANTATSTLANVVVFVVVPFLIYYSYRRWKHDDSAAEVTRLTGLQWGERRYIGYCALVALALVGVRPPTRYLGMSESEPSFGSWLRQA